MKPLFVILTIIFLVACKKENENVAKFLPFITAGQTEGIGIKYVDFEPDATLEYFVNSGGNAKLDLDLNKDSIDDFSLIISYRHFETKLLVIPFESNAVCVSKTGWAKSLAFVDTIGSNNNWSNSDAILYQYVLSCQTLGSGPQICSESTYGDWKDKGNYLGVKIIKDNKELFGWIDVKMKGSGVRGYGISVPY